MIETYFTRFIASIDDIELPKRFTFPFNYIPHPLCVLAAEELQKHLISQTDWEHDFGIDHFVDGTNVGKMFGVLAVQNGNGEIGYLSAFSGKLAGQNLLPKFVPPIVDILDENGFYRKGEDELNAINAEILQLETYEEYKTLNQAFKQAQGDRDTELKAFKKEMKLAKANRKEKRNLAKSTLGSDEYESLVEELKQESLKLQYDYKILVKEWDNEVETLREQLSKWSTRITTLKQERKAKSASLQQQIFDRYQFLNIKGQVKSVCDIFATTTLKVPPGGAGDCAAPKLLQYAFLNQLKPIAMAEFWWGQSPKSEIRKHKHFYPSCKSKCEPILGHMLHGMLVDENPVKNIVPENHKLEVVFEDDRLAVINKPYDFLSVPGKTDDISVFDIIKTMYPNATGPLIVHRLDMATSGLMVIAKDKDAHKHLQEQFQNKTVVKHYVAVLDGEVEEESGVIELPLRVDLDNRPHQLVCGKYGKPATTYWNVLDRFGDKTRIQFIPKTGRTHQLRVHAAHQNGLNAPIVGDDLYGTRANRLHLHAEYLSFIHPDTNKKVSFRKKADF